MKRSSRSESVHYSHSEIEGLERKTNVGVASVTFFFNLIENINKWLQSVKKQNGVGVEYEVRPKK